MRITLSFTFTCLLLLLSLFSTAQTVKVMSYNIRYANRSDGPNNWWHRKKSVTNIVLKYNPDIVGTQEVLHKQLRYMKRKLKHYRAVGVGRKDGKCKGEYSAVFYNKDSFELQTSNTFWLSETPEKAGSRGWDANLPRIVTWCKLKQVRTGVIVFVFNTHFDNMGSIARANSAVLLKQKVQEIAGDGYTIVLGDLNAKADESPYMTFTSMANGYVLTDIAQQNNEGTFCGFDAFNKSCSRIDYIFCNENLSVISYSVPDDQRGKYYPSDHKPIMGVLEFLHKP
jgi:endonuclease/exonuclease/phosphatase family metal-dependent hydrolase